MINSMADVTGGEVVLPAVWDPKKDGSPFHRSFNTVRAEGKGEAPEGSKGVLSFISWGGGNLAESPKERKRGEAFHFAFFSAVSSWKEGEAGPGGSGGGGRRKRCLIFSVL